MRLMEPKKRGRGRPPKAKAHRGERMPSQCTSRFVKIILHIVHEQNKLRIPDKFARRYRCESATVATLTVPTGNAWKVKISKSDNHMYFTQGWEQFMKHNSINYGYFLLFEYKGNHNFRVYIFDLSCYEIEYPVDTHEDCCEKENPIQVKEEEIDPIQVKEEAIDHLSISGTKCDQNPSFTIVLQKSNFTRNYLYVTSGFAKKYMKGDSKKYIKLQGDDGKEWHIRCYYSKRRNWVETLNGAGWKNFVQENNLEVGEEITFQLVAQNPNYITLKYSKNRVGLI